MNRCAGSARPHRRRADRRRAVLGRVGRGHRRARRAGDHPGGPRHRDRSSRSWSRSCSGVLLGAQRAGPRTRPLPGRPAARHAGARVSGCICSAGSPRLARAPRSPREEAVIAAAGPAVSAVLAGVFWLAAAGGRPGHRRLAAAAAAGAVEPGGRGVQPACPRCRWTAAGCCGPASGGPRATVAPGPPPRSSAGYVIAVVLVGWAVLLVDRCRDRRSAAGRDRGGDGVVRRGRRRRRTDRARPGTRWPADVSIQSLARPVAQLPTETPVALALDAAADRAVILTEADGVARGMLDVAGRPGAGRSGTRRAPASLVARPWRPETIVLADDDPAEVVERTRTVNAAAFLLVDDAGQPAGVLRREDILAVLHPASLPTGGTGVIGRLVDRPYSERDSPGRDLRESRLRPGRSGAVDRLQGPQVHRRAGGGGDLPHASRRAGARRSDRPTGGQPGHLGGRHVLPGAASAADRLRAVDAARRRGDLPEGRGADRALGRHLPGRNGSRGRRRFGGVDLLAAAGGRVRRAG